MKRALLYVLILLIAYLLIDLLVMERSENANRALLRRQAGCTDGIFAVARDFAKKHGRYPRSKDELEEAGFSMPSNCPDVRGFTVIVEGDTDIVLVEYGYLQAGVYIQDWARRGRPSWARAAQAEDGAIDATADRDN